MVKSKTVEIWGTGNPKREVMYVDDLASAIYFIVNNLVGNFIKEMYDVVIEYFIYIS